MQEFLEWKAFKERKLGFPAAPLAASGGGSSAYPLGLPRQLLPPRELDYNRLMDILLTKMSPVEESKHPGLYWLFKHLYIVLPASFRVTGKPHIGAHGETYMSFQFIADAPRARPVNFHAVGFYTTSPYRMNEKVLPPCEVRGLATCGQEQAQDAKTVGEARLGQGLCER